MHFRLSPALSGFLHNLECSFESGLCRVKLSKLELRLRKTGHSPRGHDAAAESFEFLDRKLLLGYAEFSFSLHGACVAFDPHRKVENLGETVFFTNPTGNTSTVFCFAEVSPEHGEMTGHAHR
jgi:hypothetical protein